MPSDAVIGFDGISAVLLGDVARSGDQLSDYSRIGRCPIGIHLGRACALLKGAREELASGCQIRFWETSTSMT